MGKMHLLRCPAQINFSAQRKEKNHFKLARRIQVLKTHVLYLGDGGHVSSATNSFFSFLPEASLSTSIWALCVDICCELFVQETAQIGTTPSSTGFEPHGAPLKRHQDITNAAPRITPGNPNQRAAGAHKELHDTWPRIKLGDPLGTWPFRILRA